MAVPEFVGGVDECRALRDTGVVHENVGIAESLAHVSKHARDAFRIGNIADKRDCSVANFMSDLFDLFSRARRDCDTHTFARKSERDYAAYASAAAGYQCCFNHG
jgi:hypothetical protein